MSSALVRQALAFVDPEEIGKNNKRVSQRSCQVTSWGQGFISKKCKNQKAAKRVSKSAEEVAEGNIETLLALSRRTARAAVADKIIERAIKGKPLVDKIEVKTEEEKSILFPEEETFKNFEKEYFCN